MTTYQYHITGRLKPYDASDILNKLGAEGWEVIDIDHVEVNGYRYTLKRTIRTSELLNTLAKPK